MNNLSLFSGIEGFGLGLAKAGITTTAHSEIDADACTVNHHHYPDSKCLGSVKEITKKTLTYQRYEQKIDIITGGFPCQDISISGQRKGITADTRSGLFFDMERVIGMVTPKWFIIENVPGLLSIDKNNGMRAVISALERRGYCVAWRMLNARYFGLAQRRKRIFLVGSFGNCRAAQILFEPYRVQRYIKAQRTQRREIARCVGTRTEKHDPTVETLIAGILSAKHTRGYSDQGSTNSFDNLTLSPTLRVGGRDNPHRAGDSSDNTPIVADIAPTLGASRSGTDQPSAQGNDYQFCIPIAFRGKAGAKAGSTGATSNEAPTLYQDCIHTTTKMGVRRLTPRECERLQGFPDDWTNVDAMKDSPRYRMLGNAVPPPVVEWIATRIQQVEAGLIPGEIPEALTA